MKYDPFAEFRKLSKDEQRENILNTCVLCIDGASVSLARKIEIYLDQTPEDLKVRQTAVFESFKKD